MFLFIVRWELAVVHWRNIGRSETFSLVAGLGGALVLLSIEFAIVFGSFALLNLKSKEERRIPGAISWLVEWLENGKPGTTRHIWIFSLAFIPVFPFLTFVSITLSRIEKSTFGYFLVFAGVILKVILIVRFIYWFR